MPVVATVHSLPEEDPSQGHAPSEIADYVDYSVMFPDTLEGRKALRHVHGRRHGGEGSGGYDDFESSLDNERKYQERMDVGALSDVSVTSSIWAASGVLKLMHDQAIWAQQTLGVTSGGGWEARLAELPVNWQSMAAAAGVLAVKSALQRVREAQRFEQADRLGDDSLLEQMVVQDRRERLVRRVGKRLGRGAVVLAYGVAAYKGAEHLPLIHSMVTSGISEGVAIGGIAYAKAKTDRIIRRRKGY